MPNRVTLGNLDASLTDKGMDEAWFGVARKKRAKVVSQFLTSIAGRIDATITGDANRANIYNLWLRHRNRYLLAYVLPSPPVKQDQPPPLF
jgi:hypothetical protein